MRSARTTTSAHDDVTKVASFQLLQLGVAALRQRACACSDLTLDFANIARDLLRQCADATRYFRRHFVHLQNIVSEMKDANEKAYLFVDSMCHLRQQMNLFVDFAPVKCQVSRSPQPTWQSPARLTIARYSFIHFQDSLRKSIGNRY